MILAPLAAVIGLPLLARRRGGGPVDVPTRIPRTATRVLPADRVEWGNALVAELAAIRPGWPRWQFSLGPRNVKPEVTMRPAGRAFALRSPGPAVGAGAGRATFAIFTSACDADSAAAP